MPTRPLVLAHRGASAAEPENTLAAFDRARELGADGVELDVRRCSDGTLVVHHDPEAAGVGLLSDVRFGDLRAARPDVPTLSEALAACAGLVVNVEVKCLPWEPDADPAGIVLREAVALARAHDGVVVVSSFDLAAIDRARGQAPDLATGWLVHGQEIDAAAAIAAGHGHRHLHPDRASVLRDPQGAVAACREARIGCTVWTVDDPEEIVALARAGVDAVITNVPDVALAALG
jgi:glycerophosphoryl diester phosphodiesterase